MASETGKVVYAALLGNILVAATKTVAAVLSGSSAMLSEAIHSFVDTGNEILLIYGSHRSRRTPDADHPFGYGRELYFWSFIVALLIFGVGAGVAFYEGIQHIRHPEPITRPSVNYIVLALSLVFEGSSWLIALRAVKRSKGSRTYWQAITCSKDPPQFMVLVEDSAAIIGIFIAFVGTWLSVTFNEPRWDGVASLLISFVLAVVSIVLARESKNLLIGERAEPAITRSVCDIAAKIKGVEGVNGIKTAQMSPSQILVFMSIEFDDDMTVVEVEKVVAELETAVAKTHAEVMAVFIKPQTPKSYQATMRKHKAAQAHAG